MRSRSVWLTACSAALAVVLGGCGGSENEAQPDVAGPKIEGAVANELATLSDEVADDIENGDACAARQAAVHLRDRVTEAINAGKVPELYLEDLSGVVNEIEVQIPACPQAPPADRDESGDDGQHGKKKGKKGKKGKKHTKDGDNGNGDQQPAETGTLPAETETVPTETTTDTTPTTATTTTTQEEQ